MAYNQPEIPPLSEGLSITEFHPDPLTGGMKALLRHEDGREVQIIINEADMLLRPAYSKQVVMDLVREKIQQGIAKLEALKTQSSSSSSSSSPSSGSSGSS